MANLKSLLKKSIHTGASALLLVSTLLPSLNLLPWQSQPVAEAATGTPTALTPGGSLDTGNHTLVSADISKTNAAGNLANWTLKSAPVNGATYAGSWLNLNNNYPNQANYGIFNSALDASQPFSATETFRFTNTSGGWYSVGDSLGFLLSRVNANNLTQGQSGAGLGIYQMPNAIFAGRDFYYNNLSPYNDVSGPGNGTGNASSSISTSPGDGSSTMNQIAIRRTSADGSQILTPSASNYANFSDPVYSSGINSNQITEPVNLKWTPTNAGVVNADGTVSGTLTLSYGAQGASISSTDGSLGNVSYGFLGTSTQKPVTVSYSGNLAKDLTLGVLSSTGGAYGLMSMNGGASFLKAQKATQPVQVNYINAVTGQAIKGQMPSTITANVGDTIGVVSPTGSAVAADTYDYAAPNLSSLGYTFKGISSGSTLSTGTTTATSNVTVLNNDPNTTNTASQTTPTNNTINVYYTPANQTASFVPWYIGGTPGTASAGTYDGVSIAYPTTSFQDTAGKAAALPNVSSTSGPIDSPAPAPTYSIPTGYSLYGVAASDNIVYLTSTYGSAAAAMNAALAANPLILASPSNFAIILQPNNHSATFSYQYASGTPGYNGNAGATAPNLPTTSVTETGTTGKPLTDPGLSMTPVGAGYTVTSIIDPSGFGNTMSPAGSPASITDVFKRWTYLSYFYSNSAKTLTNVDQDFAFIYQVTANKQTGTLSFNYDPGTPGTDATGKPYLDGSGNPIPTPSTDSTGTPGLAAALPAPFTMNGLTNAPMNIVTSTSSTDGTITISTANNGTVSAPAGYYMEHVVAPDGTVYAQPDSSSPAYTKNGVAAVNLASGQTVLDVAAASSPYFQDVSQSSNSFQIYLKGLPQTATVKFFANAAGSPDGTGIPRATLDTYGFVFASGLTGGPITANILTAPGANSGVNAGAGWGTTNLSDVDSYLTSTILPALNSSLGLTGAQQYVVSEVYDLSGNTYTPSGNSTGFTSAVNASQYYFGPVDNSKSTTPNEFDVQLQYSGSIGLEVPESISFGTNTVTGVNKTYTGKLIGGVTVDDERAASALTGWSVQVAESSPIQEVNSLGVPVLNGVNFAGNMSYNGTVLTASPLTIYTYAPTTLTGGSTTVIDQNADSPFSLYVPVNFQKINTSYQGQLAWTLTVGP